MFAGFRERGATVHQIAAELGVSPSYAHSLRVKFVGLNPANSIDKEKVFAALRDGNSVQAVAEMFSVSNEWVREHAIANNVVRPRAKLKTGNSPRPLSELAEFLRFHFSYDAETGQIFRDGQPVGAKLHGYISIKVKDRKIRGHRLAWFLHYGTEPPDLIDHVDGNPLNNAIANIREADHSQNAFNRRRAANNSTGVKGVAKDKRWDSFRVTVMAYGQKVFSSAPDLASAVEKRRRLADEMHGEFARHD